MWGATHYDNSGEGWMIRDDTQAHVAQGDVLSVWVRPGTSTSGRAHFAFGATGAGALSAVLAWDTNQLILENNAGFGHVELAEVSQTYLENHWYRLEVAWAFSGEITARLYDSDGTTPLNSVSATDATIAAGGIGFGIVGSGADWDTVTRAGRGGNRARTVEVGYVQVATGIDFGNFEPGTVEGIKWDDENADGLKDTGESVLSGWRIYVDLNDDGAYQAGEPTDVTDTNGEYAILDVPLGTYKVREVLSSGWAQTTPAVGYYEFTFTSGSSLIGIDFGNRQVFDFGDAPAPYPTLRANNGPRHVPAGPTLGANRDAEADGQPTAGAVGDDDNGVPDDEDGVSFVSPLIVSHSAGKTGSVTVDASAAARLDAWIDFNSDGDWADGGEQIFTDYAVAAGSHAYSFTIPAGPYDGTTYSRFRLSTAGGLPVTGPADDGEVEDHQVTLVPELTITGVTLPEGSGTGPRTSTSLSPAARTTQGFPSTTALATGRPPPHPTTPPTPAPSISARAVR